MTNTRSIFQARRAVLGCVAVLTISLIAGSAYAQSAKNKLLIQVSDAEPAKWNLALNNAKNVQEELGVANVQIEIVAYGPGINMLKLESASGPRIAEALKSGMKIVACENTMRNQKLTREDMLGGITYVPAGVVEIMQKQSEAWAYVKP